MNISFEANLKTVLLLEGSPMGIRKNKANLRHSKLALFDARYEFKRPRKQIKALDTRTTYPNLEDVFEKAVATYCNPPSTDQ